MKGIRLKSCVEEGVTLQVSHDRVTDTSFNLLRDSSFGNSSYFAVAADFKKNKKATSMMGGDTIS